MSSTAHMKPVLVERPNTPTSEARSSGHAAGSDGPTFGEIVDEILPITDVVFVAGPPVIFVAVPWLLLALMLSGPFAVLVALMVLLAGVVVLFAAIVAIVATPCLVVRGVYRRYRAAHAMRVPRTHLAPLDRPRVLATIEARNSAT
jgi:hypothetical protein